MAAVPEIFLTAAAWAQGRPFGDVAGMAVRDLLDELTGPPRIGVCTVDAPVVATVPGAVMVRTTWPAVGSGTDVVLLVHPGEVSGRMRSRMRAGPQKFVHIEDKEQAENYTIGVSELLEIRERLLAGELRALAARYPQLMTWIPDVEPVEVIPPRVVVIGPDPDEVAAVRARLRAHVTVVDSVDADVVVAVPGDRGFMLVDAPVIQDAWQRVGRLVSLSPLPTGVCPLAVPAGRDLVETITRVSRQPAGCEVPAVPTGRWVQAYERMRVEQQAEIRRLHREGDRTGMRELAGAQGVVLSPGPRLPTRCLLGAAVLILGACVIRVDLVPVVLGISGVHLFRQYQREVARWWETAVQTLSLDTTSAEKGDGRGPQGWLRRQVLESGRTA